MKAMIIMMKIVMDSDDDSDGKSRWSSPRAKHGRLVPFLVLAEKLWHHNLHKDHGREQRRVGEGNLRAAEIWACLVDVGVDDMQLLLQVGDGRRTHSELAKGRHSLVQAALYRG